MNIFSCSSSSRFHFLIFSSSWTKVKLLVGAAVAEAEAVRVVDATAVEVVTPRLVEVVVAVVVVVRDGGRL